jgi:membrane fusion protein (multidrug efflux system)
MMMTSRAKRIAPGAAALALFLMAFLGVRHERQRTAPKVEDMPELAPMSVEVGYEQLARVQQFPADIRPWIDVELRSPAGLVLERLVEPGVPVKKGDPILKLEETHARNALDAALARHAETSRALVETERLKKSGAVGDTALEAALAEVRESRSRLDNAREVLARHTIRSPISGILSLLDVRSGEAVQENQLVGVVADVDKLRVFVNVPQLDLGFFRPGEKIPLRLLPAGRELAKPEVLFQSPAPDPQSGLFKIEAILDNKNHLLVGKTQGIVEIETQVFPEGPVVPAQAVRFSENGTQVHREEKGKPVPVPVKLGPEISGLYPVLQGLQAGERVFVSEAP